MQVMLASEAVNYLNELIKEHGDKPLAISDADTRWLLNIQNISAGKDKTNQVKYFYVEGDYDDRLNEE